MDRTLPFVLMSTEGHQFGFPGHFDAGCSGTMSYQLQGTKYWRVWSPWKTLADSRGNPGYPAHTRFEGVVRPGDAIIYPPGYFHTTSVQHKLGDARAANKTGTGRISVAATFYLPSVPWWGSLRSVHGPPGAYSPLGYKVRLFV